MPKIPDHPQIRNEVLDPLYFMIDNVIKHYLKHHKDMTNEELDVIFNRLITFQRQQEIHMYSLYMWDLKKEEQRLLELKAKKSDMYK